MTTKVQDFMTEEVTSTTIDLNDVTSSINTNNKYVGRQVFNTTDTRPIYASGTLATDVWVYSDGTTSNTPV